jgi:hypothetical protein
VEEFVRSSGRREVCSTARFRDDTVVDVIGNEYSISVANRRRKFFEKLIGKGVLVRNWGGSTKSKFNIQMYKGNPKS